MKHKAVPYLVLSTVLMTLCALSLAMGSANLSPTQWLGGLLRREGYETASTILYAIRLPRMIAALCAGAGLSLSGVLLQTIMGNPLASPNTVGVNAGAGLFVILCLSLFPTLTPFLPLAAFLGAMVSLGAVILISRFCGGMARGTVILAGIACTTLFQAGISLFNILDSDVLVTYNSFSVGSLAGVRLGSLILPILINTLCTVTVLCLSGRISALTLGDTVASSLGIRVGRLRILCLLLAGACAAAAVSFAGLLGFVGLVAPHLARKLFGHSIRTLAIAAPLLGAAILCASDLLARTLFAPAELPVGIVMSLVGAPFLLSLLIRKEKYHA